MVVGRRQQISQTPFHPLILFEGTAKRAMPVATTVILDVSVQAFFVVALVAMITQIFAMASMDPGKYSFGVFIYWLIIGTAKQTLKGWFTIHG